jgi:hypothetical protein
MAHGVVLRTAFSSVNAFKCGSRLEFLYALRAGV